MALSHTAGDIDARSGGSVLFGGTTLMQVPVDSVRRLRTLLLVTLLAASASLAYGDAVPDSSQIAKASNDAVLPGGDSPAYALGRSLPSVSPILVGAYAPAKPDVHRFWDKSNVMGFTIHAAVRSADALQTCVMLARGARELWLPTQSCSGVAAYSLATVPAQIGTSYLLHRLGCHRLERWMPYLWTAPSAAGIGMSMKYW